MKRKAFITGINGQDGSFLSELLLDKDMEVYGIVRRHSYSEGQDIRIAHLESKINTDYCDVTDANRLNELIKKIKPDFIFHLAAQSHVKISFEQPINTIEINTLGTANILEAYRLHAPKARFYFAASSEMFGNSIDNDGFQRETTPMHPVSPYGCSKLFGYALTRHYRRAHNLFACNGILFNHESERRGSAFVTAKIAKAVAQIYLGQAKSLKLGNIHSFRDFGHSKDYVEAMYSIVNHDRPDDFIISTGETHEIKEFCEKAFGVVGLDYKQYVSYDDKFKRAEELNWLKGDSTKARAILKWKPKISFDEMIGLMVNHWMQKLKNDNQ